MAQLEADSIDLSVYSPPFISLYTYTASPRDIGNCASEAEFFAHFGFAIAELLRVTKPGRLTCVHVAQVPAMLERDGYIGMKDFRGNTIDAYRRRPSAPSRRRCCSCSCGRMHRGSVRRWPTTSSCFASRARTWCRFSPT
jgi:hypothetical protein